MGWQTEALKEQTRFEQEQREKWKARVRKYAALNDTMMLCDIADYFATSEASVRRLLEPGEGLRRYKANQIGLRRYGKGVPCGIFDPWWKR